MRNDEEEERNGRRVRRKMERSRISFRSWLAFPVYKRYSGAASASFLDARSHSGIIAQCSSFYCSFWLQRDAAAAASVDPEL